MIETERVTHIFQDAWTLYGDAMEELERGRLRNAAEKAWGATKRATDALILARTGDEPRTAGRTLTGLRILSRQDERVRTLLERHYLAAASFLHGACFYDGMCEPEDVVESDIRETADYIRDAQELARAQ